LMDAAPKSVREIPSQESYTGRILAIDASMCLYQFLIMIRENRSGAYQNMTNADGDVTSHIIGFLTRTIRLMEAGIKPVYVFDGKPPEMKLEELAQRWAKREEAEAHLKEAVEAGDQDQILKATKMSTKVTKEHNEQVKKLLQLMGLPIVEAPSEAEATCAALCRDGKVYAAATEDADCLTFGTKLLVRNLMAAESQKKQIYEVSLSLALEQLNVSMDQFIDFCILSGCDYCDTVKGIGPTTAMKLVALHGNLEEVIKNLDTEKNPLPDNFNYKAAREFFKDCEAVDTTKVDFQWRDPDIEGLMKFLVEENSFSQERVDRYVARLKASKSKTKQRPLDSFFGSPKVVVNEKDKYDPNKKKSAAKAGAKAKAKAGDGKRPANSSSAGSPAKRSR